MNDKVLLIHSGGFTSRQWRRLGELLAPQYDVLAPDLLGYGGTPWPEGEAFQFSQDLDYLESRIDAPMHLVGHSYGGFLAMQLALRRPELVRSIAAYEPVAFGVLDDDERGDLALVSREWDPEPWLRAFVDWWNGAGAWEQMNEPTRASFRAVGWKVFQEVLSLTADRTPLATYATITVPTLLLAGERTPWTERRVVEKLGAALPRATVQWFEGVGHMGPISHAALINDAIAAHLDRIRDGA
jgi:pimeloyl-ACP methyl ester carboxylesterase